MAAADSTEACRRCVTYRIIYTEDLKLSWISGVLERRTLQQSETLFSFFFGTQVRHFSLNEG